MRKLKKEIMLTLEIKICQMPGDNTEKIWAHRFFEKPNKIVAGGLGGAVSSPECPG